MRVRLPGMGIEAIRAFFAGRPAEFVLVQDVTERKKAENALRISEDRYRDLVDNSHELICTHDLEGRVLSVNPWAARVLGYPPESIIGRNIRGALLPEYRDKYTDVQPGYHMNKKHWNTIILDGQITWRQLKEWVDDSYNLVVDSLPKKEKEAVRKKAVK